MPNLYTHQDSNIRKTWFLIGIFFILLIAIGYFLSVIFDSSFILYLAVGLSTLTSVYSYWSSDKLVIAMTGAKEADPHKYRMLHTLVENLAITTGLPKPRVYVVNEPQPNAFATGRDPEHGVVAVTTGLLEKLDKKELEGVLAHELAHIGNRDMLVSTVAVVLAGTLALVSDIVLRSFLWGGSGSRDNKNVSPAIMIIGVIAIILAPLAATIIRLAVSRKREFLADATGALTTRYPEGLASALEKIAHDHHGMKSAKTATAHLYISNPFKGRNQVNFLTKMFMTHPPTEERVAALRGMKTHK